MPSTRVLLALAGLAVICTALAFIVFFALIGGLSAFGTPGLFIGPLVVAFFLALLRMYRRDFKIPDEEAENLKTVGAAVDYIVEAQKSGAGSA